MTYTEWIQTVRPACSREYLDYYAQIERHFSTIRPGTEVDWLMGWWNPNGPATQYQDTMSLPWPDMPGIDAQPSFALDDPAPYGEYQVVYLGMMGFRQHDFIAEAWADPDLVTDAKKKVRRSYWTGKTRSRRNLPL